VANSVKASAKCGICASSCVRVVRLCPVLSAQQIVWHSRLSEAACVSMRVCRCCKQCATCGHIKVAMFRWQGADGRHGCPAQSVTNVCLTWRHA
jgi:hypothetical protein